MTVNDWLRTSGHPTLIWSVFILIIRKAKLKMPDTILRYKYLSIDDSFKDEFAKGSLSIIKDGTIKFSSPKDFNDPFDCNPAFDLEFFINSVIKENESNFINNESKRIFYKLMSQEFEGKNIIQKFVDFGILCLSKTPIDLLMWAHYAKQHTGFVVEFSVPRKNLLEVKYEMTRPVFKSIQELNKSNNTFKNFIVTKSPEWKYEQEERVIMYLSGLHKYDRKTFLKSVIAGMRMKDDDFETLKKAVETVNQELGINVTLHKAEPLKGKFALYVPDREDLNIHNKFDKTDSL